MPGSPVAVPFLELPAAQYALILTTAAGLGAALGVLRPVRRAIVPRSWHVVQAQILLAIVGALIIIAVGESLARAFAIVGAAGLVRYRTPIRDPKDAGVMLVALGVGLTVGAGMYLLAGVACALVIVVLWVLESLEPPTRARFELTIGSKDAGRLRVDIEHALGREGVAYELLGSSSRELHYRVIVPVEKNVQELTRAIRGVDDRHGTAVEWDIKKQKMVKP